MPELRGVLQHPELHARYATGHAEWVETRDLTRKNFDSYLRIKEF